MKNHELCILIAKICSFIIGVDVFTVQLQHHLIRQLAAPKILIMLMEYINYKAIDDLLVAAIATGNVFRLKSTICP